VSITSVYNKLNGLEPTVTAALVSHTADRLKPVIVAMGGQKPPLVAGYRVRILDGNHLAATERRLQVLRGSVAGPLPGHALVVLDPALMLATHLIPCEDGHAQERSLSSKILALVEPDDLWIADRNFCTSTPREDSWEARRGVKEWLGRRSRSNPAERVKSSDSRTQKPHSPEHFARNVRRPSIHRDRRDSRSLVPAGDVLHFDDDVVGAVHERHGRGEPARRVRRRDLAAPAHAHHGAGRRLARDGNLSGAQPRRRRSTQFEQQRGRDPRRR
jgi:hypothetical protein